jgi:predicted esterase
MCALSRPRVLCRAGSAWPRPFEALVGGLADQNWAQNTAAGAFNPRTLHVYDMDDPINPGEQAARICSLMGTRAESLQHKQGHGIPMDEAQVIAAFLATP